MRKIIIPKPPILDQCSASSNAKALKEIFADISDILVVFDDIIVADKDESKQDEFISTVLEHARKHNVRLN